ncbi:MAG: Tol-Pal system TolQ [Myxococcales bacterium]|nr:Tol-Pal system TolQ [Myxococcales bacterium]
MRVVPLSTMVTLLLSAPVAAQGNGSFDLLQLLLGASGVVRGVLFLLVCLSIIGWYVIGYKALYLNRAQNESMRFLEAFWQAKRLDAVYQEAEQKKRSPIAHMFKAGYVELSKLQTQKSQGHAPVAAGESWHGEGDLENIERALRRAATHESTVLESMVPFLATVGSAAPFIGLFGTVIGIIDAFHQIASQGSANLATVAPGIAEALGTTAVGLIAAVPAVMAYNWFARKIKVLSAEMDAFSNDFLNIVKRHFLR